MASIIDIHPHIVSDDERRYPRNPMHSLKPSHWTLAGGISVEGLIAAMDRAGVAKAAVVQAASCYSYDNSYLCDSLARYPDRLTGVGFVDVLQPDAVERIHGLMNAGVSGLRLFTATSAGAFDPSLLNDFRVQQILNLCADAGVSMALQADPSCWIQVAAHARRFPQVKFILDHAGRPDVSDGPPYKNASILFDLAQLENIYLKLTPRNILDSRRGKARPETLFPRLVEIFGAHRLAWGSNFPASEGGYQENLEEAQRSLSSVSASDQEWIFAKTAQKLYPKLAD